LKTDEGFLKERGCFLFTVPQQRVLLTFLSGFIIGLINI